MYTINRAIRQMHDIISGLCCPTWSDAGKLFLTWHYVCSGLQDDRFLQCRDFFSFLPQSRATACEAGRYISMPNTETSPLQGRAGRTRGALQIKNKKKNKKPASQQSAIYWFQKRGGGGGKGGGRGILLESSEQLLPSCHAPVQSMHHYII